METFSMYNWLHPNHLLSVAIVLAIGPALFATAVIEFRDMVRRIAGAKWTASVVGHEPITLFENPEFRKEGEGRWTEHSCFRTTSYRVSKLTGSVYIDPRSVENPQLHGVLLVTDDRKKFTKIRDAHTILSKPNRQEVVKAINDFYKEKRTQRPTSQDILRQSHLPTPSEAIQDDNDDDD